MNRWKQWLSALRRQGKGNRLPVLSDACEKTNQYLQIFRGSPPWLSDCGGHSLHLARTVCRELGRTVCAELSLSVSKGERGAYLKSQLDRFLPRFPAVVSGVLGVGHGMLRLYPTKDGKIFVDFVLPDRYYVTARREDGSACGVCFFEECKQGNEKYLRCEEHRLFSNGDYLIENRAFLAVGDSFEREVPLAAVKRWEAYPKRTEVSGMSGGFFVEWRLSASDWHASGEPIYAGAISLMKDADRQYERLLWEFEGGELAVDASEDAFRLDPSGTPVLPLGKDRLFRMNAIDAGSDNGEIMKVFSPALRDESLIRGLNRILMFFEDAVGVARGTVSDPSASVKTATEIKSMRQRTYLTVNGLRQEAQAVLLALFDAMQRLCSLYRLSTAEQAFLTVAFGDGILTDSESLRDADRADVQAGIMNKEEYREKWYKGGRNNDTCISEGAGD